VVDTKLLSFFEDFKTFYVLGNKAVVARNREFFLRNSWNTAVNKLQCNVTLGSADVKGVLNDNFLLVLTA
jgi:hypothetical protein